MSQINEDHPNFQTHAFSTPSLFLQNFGYPLPNATNKF